MQRYFLNESYTGQTKVEIGGADFHHIVRVMRMATGDRIWGVFLDGKAAELEIEAVADQSIQATLIDWEVVNKEMPIKVTIASGLPKGDKLEWIIQKGTEIGASEFVPFIAERSIVKWEEKKGAKKLDRWNKIAKEAAEQSHRQSTPLVRAPLTFKNLIELGKQYDRKIVAYEEEAKGGEKSQFAKALNASAPGDHLLLVFGPEGGLSEKEAKELESHGFVLCGLGPRILRTETAPLYALAAISYHFELMG